MVTTKAITEAPSNWVDDLDEAGTVLGETIAVLESRIETLNSDMACGALRLLRGGLDLIDSPVGARTIDDLEDISAQIACGLAVLNGFLDAGNGDVPTHAALRLATLAKEGVDRAVKKFSTASTEASHV